MLSIMIHVDTQTLSALTQIVGVKNFAFNYHDLHTFRSVVDRACVLANNLRSSSRRLFFPC